MSDVEDPDFQLMRAIYHKMRALGPEEQDAFMRRVLAAGHVRVSRKERSVKKARRR